MRTIGDDIKRDRALKRQQKSARIFVPDPSGLRFIEKGTGTKLMYCAQCKAPVVDSDRARKVHAQRFPKCSEAMRIV